MSKVMILNGSPRRNGNTSKLVKAFTEGAVCVGNTVTEFYLSEMNINGCRGCLRASKNSMNPCTQKDDMEKIYSEFIKTDVIVFASPIYFWTITGQLKTTVDRLYAELECLGYGGFKKKSVLLMTAGGSEYSHAITWYRFYENNLGWENLGEVLGRESTKDAFQLGKTI